MNYYLVFLHRYYKKDEERVLENAHFDIKIYTLPNQGEAMDVEFVISPAGDVYVRHPVRQAMELGFAKDALGNLEGEQ